MDVANMADHESAVRKPSDTDPGVDMVVDEIDDVIGQHQLEVDVGKAARNSIAIGVT